MGLAETIMGYVQQQLAGHARRVGTVTGTTGTKVIVTVNGNSVTLSRLASYAPTVGDVVHIDTAGDGWLVLGKSA